MKKKTKERILKYKGQIVYFADPMVSSIYETVEEEFDGDIKPIFENNGIKLMNIKVTDKPPFGNENYDVLLFDWGGMSLGNSLMENFIRQIYDEALEKPSKYYVMTSAFSKDAMEDAIQEFGEEKPFNIFLDIKRFISFLKS